MLRGPGTSTGRHPEDWIASTTTLFGDARTGLSTLPDGRLLRDAVAAAPAAWLGDDHVAAFGADTCLLVKLLDAGQRLPVHVHPDRPFAGQHLGAHHGKTEAWFVIDPGPVYLGFARDVDPAQLRHWVDAQDVDAMLRALHRLDVSAGDTVLVPAGTPHAIGAGVFCLELQEPTDLSILLETAGFGAGGHLGLGYDVALGCVRGSALTSGELAGLWRHAGPDAPVAPLFGGAADPFFRAERIRPGDAVTVPASFAVVVVLDGAGTVTTECGAVLAIRSGDACVVPHGAGALTISGDVDLVRCRPPAPA